MMLPMFEPAAVNKLGPCTVTLRPYQEAAIDAVRDQYRDGIRSTLLILPTGTGKTLVVGGIARRAVQKGRRVLMLAHRGELIEQAVDKFERMGLKPSVEKAQSRARAVGDPDVVVATVQSMQRGRLQSWPKDYFGLVVIDECHHSTAITYKNVLNYFESARILGVTATADRADEDNIGSVFETVAYELSLWDAMTAPPPGPYLCNLRVVQCDVAIDLRDIRTTAGDFNAADLEARISPLVEVLANAIRQEIGERQTLVFTPDVGSATAMASALRSLGLAADWVAGDSRDRKIKIEAYRESDTKILCSCALLTEGFDAPPTSAIVLCRPTKSRPLMAQMVGRGTRIFPGKDDCLIVDFDYLTSKHDLVKPVELLDTSDKDPEVLELAQKILKDDPSVTLAEAVEKGEIEHKERQAVKMSVRLRNLCYGRRIFEPAAAREVLGMPSRSREYEGRVPSRATARQVEILEKKGIVGASSMSKRSASSLLDALFKRQKEGLASYKQVCVLLRNGVEPSVAQSVTFDEASRMITGFFGKRSG